MGAGSSRHRPRRRDAPDERRGELPIREACRERPVHSTLPGSPVSTAGARRVLIVGSANVDFTVAASRLPGVGETVSGGSLLGNHGGRGANQAVAARRLGADVRFIGCVGDDPSGRAISVALRAEGIGADGIMVTADAATGTALIVVDTQGRNQIAVAPGAN